MKTGMTPEAKRSTSPPDHIVITDVGSTTTKAILISRDQAGRYRITASAEAPTTVEAPHEDVMIGISNSLTDLGRVSGITVLKDCRIDPAIGAYLSTSSAGGGLQVLVCGVMKKVTAESAARAALGAGAVLLDVICSDDERPTFQKMDLVRSLRPDMVLVSGGIDGGNTQFAVEIADLLNAANPQPRFGKTYKIPLIFAGNKDAGPMVLDTAKDSFDVSVVPNLRPTLDREELGPARESIHELFMSHVMAQAPGYRQLLEWVSAPVLPTPAAAGRMIGLLSGDGRKNVVGMDIGGATTDIFSVFGGDFQRSVSANLGMSYSAANVLVSAGAQNVLRWLPFEISAAEIADEVGTKMIFPTTLPQHLTDLMVEQAIGREALRLAYEQHKEVGHAPPTELSALKRLSMSAEQAFEASTGRTKKPWHEIDILVGSGGVLSHAPARHQAALMMLDAFMPTGITELVLDGEFTLPHLGVLSTVWPKIAEQVLWQDCLLTLGTAICPTGAYSPERSAVHIKYTTLAGKAGSLSVNWGEIGLVPLAQGDRARVRVEPQQNTDAGRGAGRMYEIEVNGGEVGLIIDARGRPMATAPHTPQHVARWMQSIGAYTPEQIASASAWARGEAR